jgi:methionine synthase II (cobalamin-independent)
MAPPDGSSAGPAGFPASATGVGSMPGTDRDAAARLVLDTVPDLVPVPELPGRGPSGDAVGRTAALLEGIPVEVGPDGWALASRDGRDRQRAAELLAADLDAFALAAHGVTAAVKVQLLGPVTLAATLLDRRGHRAVTDSGLRRDLAQALAEAAVAHIADVRRRIPTAAAVVLQLDEPGLPAALEGALPTPSGLGRVAALEQPVARTLLATVVGAVREQWPDPPVAVHCCAAAVPVDVLVDAGVLGLSFDLRLITRSDLDALAGAVDRGAWLWPGVVDPRRPAEGTAIGRDRVLRLWRSLGQGAGTARARTVVTPACGLVGIDPGAAQAALAQAVAIGAAVAEADDGPRS